MGVGHCLSGIHDWQCDLCLCKNWIMKVDKQAAHVVVNICLAVAIVVLVVLLARSGTL